jgi:hypothetical protein
MSEHYIIRFVLYSGSIPSQLIIPSEKVTDPVTGMVTDAGFEMQYDISDLVKELIEIVIYCIVVDDLSYAYDCACEYDVYHKPAAATMYIIDVLYELLLPYISTELKERINNSVIEHITISEYQTFDMLTVVLDPCCDYGIP